MYPNHNTSGHGVIGSRARLKPSYSSECTGSSPVARTMQNQLHEYLIPLCCIQPSNKGGIKTCSAMCNVDGICNICGGYRPAADINKQNKSYEDKSNV